jgi:hypothetical protein
MTKRLIVCAYALLIAAATLTAHGANEHVRGVVTEIAAKAITVRIDEKTTKSYTITDKTTVQQSGKAARLVDVKVGQRVVIDVPEKTTDALLIQIGVAQAK